jgi:hypothetical protein
MNENGPGPERVRKNGSRGASTVLVLFLAAVLTAVLSCDNPTESKSTKGSVRGFLLSSATNRAVGRPAWVFDGNRLLASADASGAYEIASLEPGTYTLTGSALNHRDTVLTIQVKKGSAVLVDFTLNPDAAEKRAIGEFQNAAIFRDSLAVNPAMAGWDAKEVYDALTGATIQGKPPINDYNDRQVFIGDSLLDTADNWGQYSFRLKANTVPLRGSCPGYKDTVIVAKMSPAARIIVNFFMEPEG